MKKLLYSSFLLVMLLLFTFGASAQTSPASVPWQHNLETAKAQALADHKPILLVFSGSDWCKPCIMLHKEVWETEAFQQFAQDKLVLVELDFPRFKKNQLPAEQAKYNEQLADEFNKEGIFPLVVLLDEQGQVLAKTGYQPGGPTPYIAHLQNLLTK